MVKDLVNRERYYKVITNIVNKLKRASFADGDIFLSSIDIVI